ncbi:hypothetical protein HMPREF9065_01387 [Aggregatibacter sp. oral taxon 458 str. W10330]|nr:hypothetical protein HMPREF9065_01387 [Aggregatibacter sp. oral taxon 458 str. W10330]
MLFEASFYSDRNLFTEKIDFFSLNLKKKVRCVFSMFLKTSKNHRTLEANLVATNGD